MQAPKITALIPAYNAAHTIGRALDSVWRQNRTDLEVVLVNDASTDDTLQTVRRIAGDRVTIIDLPKNLGECGAMNAGIARARGEYIAFLDADDEWCAGKFEKQLPLIEGREEVVFVSGGGEVVLPDGTVEAPFGLEMPEHQGRDFWKGLLRRSIVAKPTVIARRSALLAVGGFTEALRVSGDQDMWIRLALIGEVAFVPERLMRIWVNAQSLTRRYARREAEFGLPMIVRHVRSQSHRLSRRELHSILGERYTRLGRNLYGGGYYRHGLALVVRGMMLGDEPLKNGAYLLSASPPARWLKRMVGVEKEDPVTAQREPAPHA